MRADPYVHASQPSGAELPAPPRAAPGRHLRPPWMLPWIFSRSQEGRLDHLMGLHRTVFSSPPPSRSTSWRGADEDGDHELLAQDRRRQPLHHVRHPCFVHLYPAQLLADTHRQRLEMFYQPKKSRHIALVTLHGEKMPLYGAGATFLLTDTGGVPLTVDLAVRTRGYVIGRLVMVTHPKRVVCPVVVSSRPDGPITVTQTACSYT